MKKKIGKSANSGLPARPTTSLRRNLKCFYYVNYAFLYVSCDVDEKNISKCDKFQTYING
jgi:hypothetical protein